MISNQFGLSRVCKSVLQIWIRHGSNAQGWSTSTKLTAVQTPLSKTGKWPHMRRLFEAVAEPIAPNDPEIVRQKPAPLRCTRPVQDKLEAERTAQLTPRLMAQKNYVRQHLLEAMVIVVCHEHPTDTRIQRYELMQMAADGVAMIRQQEPRVMRSVLHGTTLDLFASFFDDDAQVPTSLMFTKRYVAEEDDGRSDIVSGKVRDENYLPLLLRYAKAIKWIVPLAIVYEDRILTVKETEKMVSMLRNPIQVRGETVALLTAQMAETGRLLDGHATALTLSLQAREEQLKAGDK